MLKKVKENKFLFFFITVLYIILVYCHMNSFIISDDLTYSLFKRAGPRITNIFEIIENQIYDYSNVNSRVIIHFFVQLLLIHGKTIWNFLNPVVIIIGILYMSKIIQLQVKKRISLFLSFLSSAICFFLLFDKYYLVYWLAGSINYVWVFTMWIIYIYYFLKGNLKNKYLINYIVMLLFVMLCECSMVMCYVFIIGNMALRLYKKGTIHKKDLAFIVILVLGAIFHLSSPGNLKRLSIDPTWNSLSFLSKISISLPIVSYNLFNLNNVKDLLPVLFFIGTILNLLKDNDKKLNFMGLLLSISGATASFSNNKWLYVLFSLLLLICNIIYYITNKEYKMLILFLMFYVTSYFIIITPEYYRGRVNYYFDLFMGIYFFIALYNNYKTSNLFNIVIFIISLLLIIIHCYIYTKIGNFVKERNKNIEVERVKNSGILKIREIPFDCDIYHIDCNFQDIDYYWASDAFLKYYNLDKNTKIISDN